MDLHGWVETASTDLKVNVVKMPQDNVRVDVKVSLRILSCSYFLDV